MVPSACIVPGERLPCILQSISQPPPAECIVYILIVQALTSRDTGLSFRDSGGRVTHFIRSGSLTNFPEVARQAGLHPERLMREFGLPSTCLDEPDLMMPIDPVRQLLEAAAERSGCEALGLLMAEERKLSSLGPLGMFVREQPTLRDGIDAFAHYARLLNEALMLTLEESGDVAVLREELLVGNAGSVRQATELAIGVAFQMMRSFLGPDWRPRRVCFVHDAPRDRSVHWRVLGRDVHFGQDFNGIVCAQRDLTVANPHADPTMARYARQLLEGQQPTGTQLLTTQVRQLVVMQLGSGQCCVERVAQMLRIDRRTIHRRLRQEGQSFSGIVDTVRRELATRYLADRQRTLAEISALLGFAAPSGFSRWYKQQFGKTAADVRSGSAEAKRAV
jgi:AraC-like DNA-binding protein